MDNLSLSNEQLVASLQIKFEEDKFKVLMQRFKPMIRKYANFYYIPTYDYDDFEQTAFIVMFKAVKTFDPKINKYFAPFLKKAYVNKLKNEIRYAQAQRRGKNETTILTPDINDDVNTKYLVTNYQESICAVIAMRNIYEEVIQNFSRLEKRVFLLYLKEKEYSEIAESLNIKERSVKDTIYRIRQKFKQMSNDCY